jgi:Family of unknown function (DUF6176)
MTLDRLLPVGLGELAVSRLRMNTPYKRGTIVIILPARKEGIMNVELSRFRVKKDKSFQVDEWMKMLNDNMSEVIQTLDREQMKLVWSRLTIVPPEPRERSCR